MRTINHDIALKCHADVADVVRRNMKLTTEPEGMVQVAVAAAASALATVTGAYSGFLDLPADMRARSPDLLDEIWREILRPMAIAAMSNDDSAMRGLLARIGE